MADALLARLRIRVVHERVLLIAFLEIAQFLVRGARVLHVYADAAV